MARGFWVPPCLSQMVFIFFVTFLVTFVTCEEKLEDNAVSRKRKKHAQMREEAEGGKRTECIVR